MAIVTLEDLAALKALNRTLAGLDLGTKTIGLAISDLGWRLANPRAVIRRTKFTPDAAILIATLERERACGMVLGLPVNMDGSEGPRAQATRAFARNMAALSDLPIFLWDERLSTVAAERALLEMDVSRAKRAERIDSAAASFILQGALDRLSTLSRRGPA